jgi:hypothetical protein
MPFPGSQQSDTIELAYFFINTLDIFAIGLLAYPLWKNLK